MYKVTALVIEDDGDEEYISADDTFGFFNKRQEALTAVDTLKRNPNHSNDHNWLIVERIPNGFCPPKKNMIWPHVAEFIFYKMDIGLEHWVHVDEVPKWAEWWYDYGKEVQ